MGFLVKGLGFAGLGFRDWVKGLGYKLSKGFGVQGLDLGLRV